MSYRRRNAYSSYYGSRGGSRGPADWLGLLALVCMLVSEGSEGKQESTE